MPVLAVAIGVVVAIIVLVILFKMVWRVAEPNEALIISGLGAKSKPIDGVDSPGSRS